MKIALEWLREMAPVAGEAAELAERLTMGGLEVEEPPPVPSFSQVVVGRILRVERHPNADRLTVCQVDTGGGATRTVVCGAPNVSAGLTVPCALPGARLPGGLLIKVSTVRGVRSDGMLCSARELGLSEDAQGLLILDETMMPGADLREALGLDEPIFDIKTTPNRGDCLSVLGVARELAALSGQAMAPPSIDRVVVNSQERLAVRIDAPDLCGRFSGRVVRGVNARAATPAWMRRRLEQSGQRCVSALVDISNYVMLELGQPSHVFDLKKIDGELQIRWARPGERITLLNEQSIELDTQVGVVADNSGAAAIAGIMGGLATSISLDTQDVYLEAAFWWPEAIQGRPRRLSIASEAAHRFERGVDFAGTTIALERLAQLIVQICATPQTRVGPISDVVARPPRREPVLLRLSRLQQVLGIALSKEKVEGCFARLDLAYEREGEVYRVTPPSFRFDLQLEVDLIEEVARLHGYASIPAEPPSAPARMRAQPEGERSAHDLRKALAAAGYQELINFSFVPESWESDFGADPASLIRVLNPIAAQFGVMRTNLLAGLVSSLRYNLNRQASRVRVFELGSVYGRGPIFPGASRLVDGVAQPLHLAALAYGASEDEQWGLPSRAVDFFDVKGDLERLLFPAHAQFAAAQPNDRLYAAFHPGRCARILLHRDTVGWIGELHPRLCKNFDLDAAPVLFEVSVAPLLPIGMPTPLPVPRFPALVRDIAVWIDGTVRAGEVLEDLRNLALGESKLASVRTIRLFDVFRPESAATHRNSAIEASSLLNKEKSLAFRVVLQDTHRSLAEADADAARATIVEHLLKRWGARVRQ
ncbi:MAG TPA: phenylalanine--tRNA ligase subunit beta [Burkholderiaceae bacterium]|nr:phenylalanine--tRNA ligase subunit beta [Burkholderiaceae bacterium]